MATDKEKFDALTTLIKTQIPNFEHAFKDESKLNKIISFIIKPFNPRFSTGYITTLYPKIYWPSRQSIESPLAYQVLMHEAVHLADCKRNPIKFFLYYSAPQAFAIFALGALGAFWNLSYLFFLLFLLCLAPWPSPGRTWVEMRGYTMTMALWIWKTGKVSDYEIEYISKQFTEWPYYKMWPFKSSAIKKLKTHAEMVRSGEIFIPKENQIFKDVYNLLKEMKEV